MTRLVDETNSPSAAEPHRYGRFDRLEVGLFLASLLLAVAARGAALFPLFYSIDSYIEVLSPSYHADNYVQRVSNGRFGQALLNEILTVLGASTPLANTVYSLLCMLCFIWVGLIVCRIWKLSGDFALSLLAISLITLHPYQAELFTFNSTPVYTSGSLFLAFWAFYSSRARIWSVIWTGLCLALALSLYQTVLNFVVVTFAFALALEILRARCNSDQPRSWRQIAVEIRLWPRLATLVWGLISYLMVNKAVQSILGVSPGKRAQFIALSELPLRLGEVKAAMTRAFFQPEPVFPGSVKILLAFLGSMAILLVGRRCLSSSLRHRSRFAALLLLSLLLAAAAISIIGVTLLTQGWWPMPRVLSAMSFFQAGLVALALSACGPRIRVALIAVSCVVLFAFLGINNHIFTDQLRVNLRDLHRASRIIARLEARPDFGQIQRISVVGGSYTYFSPVYTLQGDLNASAFFPPWSKVSILNEVSGYNFGEAGPLEQEEAARYCETAPRWPDPSSITVVGNLGIVCQ